LNIHFSTTLHFALIGKFDVLRWIGFDECITSMKVNESHWHLFMCLQGFVLLSAIYYYVANHKPYQSNLMQITPDISTPVSAGQKQFGSARWMTDQEKEKEFRCYEMDRSGETQIPSGGIVLGKKSKGLSEHIYYVDDDTHVLCIGATRSGKTRSIVLQTIGTLALAEESMIISDPKGELYNYTYPFLEKKGYEIICLDFKNPLKSDRYNFLQPVIDAIDKNDIPMAVDATWDLTASLVPEDNHNEKIWVNGEASIIAAAIISVVYDNRNGNDRRFQNLSNVYFFISEMCKTVNNSMPLIKYMKNMPASHPAKALLSISEVAPSKTRGSFYTSALTTLRLFTNPLIHQMTNISDLKLEDFGDKKQVIYMILPDEKSTYYSLASLFVNQCYMQLVKNADSRGGRLKRRINFCLDEFGNFVKIPDFSNKLTVGGGRGIRFN
jgi:type IV secretion system protein VirD4